MAVIALERGEWRVTPHAASREMLLRSARGMWWIGGGGAVVFMGVHWPTFVAARGDADDAYPELLFDLGRLCQLLLEPIYAHGGRGWMSPAVDEALAARVLGLDPTLESEPLYLLKFGMPVPIDQLHSREAVAAHAARMGAR
jgi:hypothetical protein